MGRLYTLVRPLLPRLAVLTGLTYGSLVWAVSYLWLMPSVRLYPPPVQDTPARTAVLIAAHGVYGVSIAEIAHRGLPQPSAAVERMVA